MGFDTFDSGDDDAQPDDPSGTHIYFYERGHDRLPGSEGDDRYEQIAEAYDNAKTSPDGVVRRYANSQYSGGLQQFLAEYVNAVADALEEQDLSIIVSEIFADESAETVASMMAQYLTDNPEVAAKLEEQMSQDAQPEPAEADD